MTNWSGDPFNSRGVAPHVVETRWSGFKSQCPHFYSPNHFHSSAPAISNLKISSSTRLHRAPRVF